MEKTLTTYISHVTESIDIKFNSVFLGEMYKTLSVQQCQTVSQIPREEEELTKSLQRHIRP